MARIGELLLEHGWVDTTNLRRALSEQALAGGQRICSLLIARGLLDPDHAARALSEQHDIPAVLQRHLEHRDRVLAELIPASFAREHCALPIGRTRGGELIVCVRDPSPDIQAAIRRALDATIVIAVAPASQLEHLIEQSYDDGENEFDVDLSTGTQIEAPTTGNWLDPRPDDEPSMPDIGVLSLVGLDDVRVNRNTGITNSQSEYKLPPRTTPPPFNVVTPPFGSITPPTQPPASRTNLPPRRTPPPFGAQSSPFASLTPPPSPPPPVDIRPELEPEEVYELALEMEPPSRPSGVHEPATTAAEPPRPSASMTSGSVSPLARSAPRVMIPIGEPLPAAALRTKTIPQVRLTITEAVEAIDDAVSRDLATEIAMRFASQRWTASLLLGVKEGAALGHRGHGTQLSPDTVRAVAIPLTTPSIVKAAHDTKKLVTETPSGAGAIHERIVRLLGQPRCAIAAPIVVAGRIACVFAVGDLNGEGDSATDLDLLTTALGDAYTRIVRDQR